MSISSHAQPVLLDLSGNELEPSGISGDLHPLYSPCPIPNLIPHSLDCVVLISRSQNQDFFSQKSAALPLHGPSAATSCSLSQHIIANNPRLAPAISV